MQQTIKRTLLILSVILMLSIMPLALFASGSKFEQSTGQPVTDISEPPRYVFVFIGDGMGMPQINAAERYLSALEGKQTGSEMLVLSQFPAQGLTTTYASDRFITGSAAAATAIATGHKTSIGVIAMDPSKTKDYKTVAEMANSSFDFFGGGGLKGQQARIRTSQALSIWPGETATESCQTPTNSRH
jgi:alkaline phosphatase